MHIMKTAIALLLAFLAVAAVMSVPVEGLTDNTYISNQANVGIIASVVYHFPGTSDFTDRTIEPQNYDHDVYDKINCEIGAWPLDPVEIDLKIVGSSNSGGSVNMDCDHGIVAVPSASGSGVDIYATVYGSINQPTGSVLKTISP